MASPRKVVLLDSQFAHVAIGHYLDWFQAKFYGHHKAWTS